MEIFVTLITGLVPLYLLILAGWIVARIFHIEGHNIANLLVMVITPAVAAGAVASLPLQPEYLLLPVIVGSAGAMIGLIFRRIGVAWLGERRDSLAGFATGSGNTGYFGLPVVIALFEIEWVGVYLLMNFGLVMFEVTLGYYMIARGAFTVRQSLFKVLRLPTLYAMALGFALNLSGIGLPEAAAPWFEHFKGAFIILGMMLIGIMLARMQRIEIDLAFNALCMAGKFIAWPVLVGAIILADMAGPGLFAPQVHRLMAIIAIVPIAANTAAYAAQLDVEPEKAATTVLVSTLVAAIYIPLVLALTGQS